jgi:hypothetical protein
MSHAARAHAKLSPSSSKRWMECPGSVPLSEGMDQSSVYAEEGTAAHMLAEYCYQEREDASTFHGLYVDIDAKDNPIVQFPGDRRFPIDEEMVDGVQTFLEYIRFFSPDDGWECESEQRVDLSHLWPDQFGTADFIAYHPGRKLLVVADFKYGRGVAVEPEENTQGMSYAAGALRRFHNRGVDAVVITVVQPRAGGKPIREWETEAERIEAFGEEFRRAATRVQQAIDTNDGGDAWQRKNLKPGEWCRFCPAAATCVARREENYRIARAEFDGVDMILPEPSAMDAKLLGAVLSRAEELETWVHRVRAYAHDQALHGNMPEGFKLVAKRANRKWKNPDLVRSLLPLLTEIDEADLYEPREIKSPAKLEGLMPGKNKRERAAALESFVHKTATGTVLAREDDPRPTVKADALGEFGAVE